MTTRIRFVKTCRRAGVVVDHLKGKSQPLIHLRGEVFSGLTGIGGVAIPGKDNVGLMLDAYDLVRRVAGSGNRSTVAARKHSGRE